MGEIHAWVWHPLVDISNYGPREWLQFIAAGVGIFVSVVGAWRTYRYSKWQIAKRLLEYLVDDEKAIKDARKAVIDHIRYGTPLTREPKHKFYDDLKVVVGNIDRQVQAQAQLDSIAHALSEDAQLGEKYVNNTSLRTATVYLLQGKLAKDRAQIVAARGAFENSLKHHKHDPEAERYLGELALAEGNITNARRHFSRAYDLAPDDRMLRAETWREVARHFEQQGRPKVELKALLECAPNFSGAEAHSQAGEAYARAGDLAAQLNFYHQAPTLWRQAFVAYEECADKRGMRDVLAKLKNHDEDVTALEQRLRSEVPWPSIRMAAEIAVLFAAALLFYLSWK